MPTRDSQPGGVSLHVSTTTTCEGTDAGARSETPAYLERPADGLVCLVPGRQVDAELDCGHGQAIGELVHASATGAASCATVLQTRTFVREANEKGAGAMAGGVLDTNIFAAIERARVRGVRAARAACVCERERARACGCWLVTSLPWAARLWP